MYNIAGKLKHRVDVYGRKEYTDELGAQAYRYEKIKSVWAAILPILGERVRTVKTKKGMVTVSETIKFIIRIDSITVANDMYFMYKGQRYDVDYAVPHFKEMQYQEVYTQLVIENDDNLIKGNVFYGEANQ